jgi:hypothetical protein
VDRGSGGGCARCPLLLNLCLLFSGRDGTVSVDRLPPADDGSRPLTGGISSPPRDRRTSRCAAPAGCARPPALALQLPPPQHQLRLLFHGEPLLRLTEAVLGHGGQVAIDRGRLSNQLFQLVMVLVGT